MPGQRTPDHTRRKRHPEGAKVKTKGLARRNAAAWRGPGEEPRNVRKAGGGVVGARLGGAVTGRYGPAPAKVVSNREPKPRGGDKRGRKGQG